MQRREFRNLPILDRHEVGALGAGLPDMPALEITREYDMRMLVKDLSIMDMTESPIVVSLGNEFIDGTRSIVLVARRATQRRVQDADIEHAGLGIGIAGHEVVGDIALSEALAVQRDLEFIENKGLSLAGREGIHIVRETQAFGDLTFCIVIAI